MIILWIVLALLAVYVLFVLAPSLLFHFVIFSGRRAPLKKAAVSEPQLAQADEFLRSQPHRPISITARDGAELHGVFFDAGSRKTALFLHGYNTAPQHCVGLQAAFLFRNGFNIAYTYLRGHSGSGGVSTLGIKESSDLLLWIPALKEQTDTEQFLLYGVSMGGTTVAYASDKLDGELVKGMVLDCSFISPYMQLEREMIRRHLPVALIGPLLTLFARWFAGIDVKVQTTDSLRHASIPALFMHGGADETVPIDKGRESYDACASAKTWYSVPGAAHTLCFRLGGEDAEKALLDFARACFPEDREEAGDNNITDNITEGETEDEQIRYRSRYHLRSERRVSEKVRHRRSARPRGASRQKRDPLGRKMGKIHTRRVLRRSEETPR